MSYVNKILTFTFVILLSVSGSRCSNLTDDLFPSSEDLSDTQTTSYDGDVGNIVDDLSFVDSDGISRNFSDYIPAQSGIVLYFTMWCAICTSHTDHIINNIEPFYANVTFLVVDYVSGSVSNTKTSAIATGINGKITVISDKNDTLADYFGGLMSKTVLIDANGEVLLNEDFRNGARLENLLNTLP
ncbi:MAG: redoxin family protein [Leptospirales bacterium]